MLSHAGSVAGRNKKKEYKKNPSSLVDGTMTSDAATRSDTNDTQNEMYSCIVRENTESMGLPMCGDRSRKSVEEQKPGSAALFRQRVMSCIFSAVF
jgi:hypothetical protein